MDDAFFPADFDPRQTVLFLGSGFSKGAISISNEELPLGGQLDDRLANILGHPPKKYSGKTLAQLANKRNAEELKNFLDKNLTVKEYREYHRQIISENWFRIYTTNFDNLVEVIKTNEGKNPNVITFRDEIPNRILRDSIIHLHGYLGRVNRNNVHSELIYALNAYADLHSDRPEWFAELNRSVRFAKHVLFVGY